MKNVILIMFPFLGTLERAEAAPIFILQKQSTNIAKFLRILFILLAAINIPLHASNLKVLPRDVLQVLNSSGSAILYSLDPTIRSGIDKQSLYTFKVLGQMHVDSKQMSLVTDALKTAVAKFTGIAPNCFDPHHNLRIVSGSHTYDFLVCFKCSALVIYKDEKVIASLGSPVHLSV